MSWRKLLSLATGARRPRPLPDAFMFGVANSDPQCEACDPEREDIRDMYHFTWPVPHRAGHRPRLEARVYAGCRGLSGDHCPARGMVTAL
jgi:hypothetical protein